MAEPTDVVQVIKQESSALGGDDADAVEWGSSPIEPQEDAIETAGVYLQDAVNRDKAVGIWREGALIKAKDPAHGTVNLLDTAGGGESNTASNVGTAGVGVFKQKTGVDLEFKKINAGEGIAVTDDTGNSEVDVALDVNGLSVNATPDPDADYLLTYDTDVGTHKKILVSSLVNAGVALNKATINVTFLKGDSSMPIVVAGLPQAPASVHGFSFREPDGVPEGYYFNMTISHLTSDGFEGEMFCMDPDGEGYGLEAPDSMTITVCFLWSAA